MVAKDQHIVPRGYLKNFSDSKNKVWAYHFVQGKVIKKSVKKICCHNYAYEVSKSDIDNILENYLADCEKISIPLIDKLIKNKIINEKILDENELKNLFKFVFLQLWRTESGRILFYSIHEKLNNDFVKAREHMTLDEIRKNEDIINKSNIWARDNLNDFDKYIQCIWDVFNSEIRFGLYISDYPILMTSDNPVIVKVLPDCKAPSMMIMKMALNPYLLLSIEICFFDFVQNTFFNINLSKEGAKTYNEQLFINSNYWIISSEECYSNFNKLIQENNE